MFPYPCPFDMVLEREERKTEVEMKMETRKEIFSPADGGMRKTNRLSTPLAAMGKITLVM